MSNKGLGPTHIRIKTSEGTKNVALKKGATWTSAKETASHFDANAKAKVVRRK